MRNENSTAGPLFRAHRLTWRNYCPVYIDADSREDAIQKAIARKPAFIPAGAQLHYGMVAVGGAVYTVPDPSPLPDRGNPPATTPYGGCP